MCSVKNNTISANLFANFFKLFYYSNVNTYFYRILLRTNKFEFRKTFLGEKIQRSTYHVAVTKFKYTVYLHYPVSCQTSQFTLNILLSFHIENKILQLLLHRLDIYISILQCVTQFSFKLHKSYNNKK